MILPRWWRLRSALRADDSHTRPVYSGGVNQMRQFGNNHHKEQNDFDLYIPFLGGGPRIPHYYGDYVRKIFLAEATVLVIFAPLFGGVNPELLPLEVLAAVALVCFAALTTPKREWPMMVNTAISILGFVVYETLALTAYADGDLLMFLAREILAVGFLFTLYFSIKTVRAMMLGVMGKQTTTGEFLERDEEKLDRIRAHTDSGD